MRPCTRIAWMLALLMTGLTPAVHAQRPAGAAVLVGSVRDSVTGRAISRTRVCASSGREHPFWSRCARVDTASAAFRLDSLPQGRWQVRVICGTMKLFGHEMGSDTLAVHDSAAVRRDWVVSADGCDPRPLRSVEATFRGYYTPGFESSKFILCASDAWFLPSDSLKTEPYDQRRAWATLRRGSFPEGFAWPEAPKDQYGSPQYYVEWHGTVTGPGNYGHMGVSAFLIDVDRVLTLRAPRRGDCQPVYTEPRREPTER